MTIAIIKVTAALFSGVIAICAVLLGLASGIARDTTDARERKDATFTALWSLIVFALCAGAIVSLSGCATIKYAECVARDNTSNPCN